MSILTEKFNYKDGDKLPASAVNDISETAVEAYKQNADQLTKSDVNAANGVAPLDANQQVPVGNLSKVKDMDGYVSKEYVEELSTSDREYTDKEIEKALNAGGGSGEGGVIVKVGEEYVKNLVFSKDPQEQLNEKVSTDNDIDKVEQLFDTRVAAGVLTEVNDNSTAVINSIKGYSIRQIFDIENVSFPYVNNGVTFTRQGNNIVANGTATANIFWSIPVPIPAGVRSYITGCPPLGSTDRYMLYREEATNWTSVRDYGNGGIGSLSVATDLLTIKIGVEYVCNNLIFTPQVFIFPEDFSGGLSGAKNFINRQYSPAGVSSTTFTGINVNSANLFDMENKPFINYTNTDYSSSFTTEENGGYSTNLYNNTGYAAGMYFDTVVGETYTVSYDFIKSTTDTTTMVTSVYYYENLRDSTGNSFHANSYGRQTFTFVARSNRTLVGFTARYSTSSAIPSDKSGRVYFDKVMVSHGATEYVPYGNISSIKNDKLELLGLDYNTPSNNDTLVGNTLTRRVGNTTISSITWDYSASLELFVGSIEGKAIGKTNVLMENYHTVSHTDLSLLTNNTIVGNTSTNQFYIKVTDCTSIVELIDKIGNNVVFYELDNPYSVTIDKWDNSYNIPSNYSVEEQIVEGSANAFLDIIYVLDVKKQIVENSIEIDRINNKVSTLTDNLNSISGTIDTEFKQQNCSAADNYIDYNNEAYRLDIMARVMPFSNLFYTGSITIFPEYFGVQEYGQIYLPQIDYKVYIKKSRVDNADGTYHFRLYVNIPSADISGNRNVDITVVQTILRK